MRNATVVPWSGEEAGETKVWSWHGSNSAINGVAGNPKSTLRDAGGQPPAPTKQSAIAAAIKKKVEVATAGPSSKANGTVAAPRTCEDRADDGRALNDAALARMAEEDRHAAMLEEAIGAVVELAGADSELERRKALTRLWEAAHAQCVSAELNGTAAKGIPPPLLCTMGEVGGLVYCLQALMKHVSSRGVVVQALQVTREMTRICDPNRQRFLTLGGLRKLERVLKVHPLEIDVVAATCELKYDIMSPEFGGQCLWVPWLWSGMAIPPKLLGWFWWIATPSYYHLQTQKKTADDVMVLPGERSAAGGNGDGDDDTEDKVLEAQFAHQAAKHARRANINMLERQGNAMAASGGGGGSALFRRASGLFRRNSSSIMNASGGGSSSNGLQLQLADTGAAGGGGSAFMAEARRASLAAGGVGLAAVTGVQASSNSSSFTALVQGATTAAAGVGHYEVQGDPPPPDAFLRARRESTTHYVTGVEKKQPMAMPSTAQQQATGLGAAGLGAVGSDTMAAQRRASTSAALAAQHAAGGAIVADVHGDAINSGNAGLGGRRRSSIAKMMHNAGSMLGMRRASNPNLGMASMAATATAAVDGSSGGGAGAPGSRRPSTTDNATGAAGTRIGGGSSPSNTGGMRRPQSWRRSSLTALPGDLIDKLRAHADAYAIGVDRRQSLGDVLTSAMGGQAVAQRRGSGVLAAEVSRRMRKIGSASSVSQLVKRRSSISLNMKTSLGRPQAGSLVGRGSGLMSKEGGPNNGSTMQPRRVSFAGDGGGGGGMGSVASMTAADRAGGRRASAAQAAGTGARGSATGPGMGMAMMKGTGGSQRSIAGAAGASGEAMLAGLEYSMVATDLDYQDAGDQEGHRGDGADSDDDDDWTGVKGWAAPGRKPKPPPKKTVMEGGTSRSMQQRLHAGQSAGDTHSIAKRSGMAYNASVRGRAPVGSGSLESELQDASGQQQEKETTNTMKAYYRFNATVNRRNSLPGGGDARAVLTQAGVTSLQTAMVRGVDDLHAKAPNATTRPGGGGPTRRGRAKRRSVA